MPVLIIGDLKAHNSSCGKYFLFALISLGISHNWGTGGNQLWFEEFFVLAFPQIWHLILFLSSYNIRSADHYQSAFAYIGNDMNIINRCLNILSQILQPNLFWLKRILQAYLLHAIASLRLIVLHTLWTHLAHCTHFAHTLHTVFTQFAHTLHTVCTQFRHSLHTV